MAKLLETLRSVWTTEEGTEVVRGGQGSHRDPLLAEAGILESVHGGWQGRHAGAAAGDGVLRKGGGPLIPMTNT